MEIYRKLITSKKDYMLAGMGSSIVIILFAVVIIFSFTNDILFHSTTEIFSSIIYFGVFIIILNTYNMNKNNFLVLLSIGDLFVAILGMVHVFSYPGLAIFAHNNDYNISMQLNVALSYLEAFTCLGSILLIYRPVKNFNSTLIFISYIFVFAVIIASIFYFKIFPTCYNEGQTEFKIISEYTISFIFVLVFILHFKLKKNIDSQMFFYMECYLITRMVTELLLSIFTSTSDTIYIISHILKVVYHLFIYKAVIELGLRRPYAVIFQKLDKFNSELKVANNKLEEEANQRGYFEEMLIKNQQFYDLIINRSSDAITVISEEKYIFVNNKALEVFGANSSNELIGKQFFDFINNDNKYKLEQYVNEVHSKSSTLISHECKIKGLTGKEVYLEITSSYILYNSKLVRINLLKDITPQTQINELENQVRENEKIISEIRDFNKHIIESFANISHELKTPLNVILGAIQLLELTNGNSSSKSFDLTTSRYLKSMKQNCYRLIRIVNNLIDVSKFDMGYFKLNLSNCNIVSVIEDIILSASDHLESKGINLIFDPEIEEKIMAIDISAIERIILNLLSNAVKFTNDGDSILVRIEDKNESIIISIKDTGIGIPIDKLDLIFERFGQVDRTFSRNNEGSGLGLCLVKSLVNMHDGTIKVKSKIGEGTEFIIDLPIRIVDEEERSQSFLCQSNVEKINIEFSDIYL